MTNKNMNVKSWKQFLITDLFDVVQEKKDNQAVRLAEGEIPLISAGQNMGNGVVKLISNPIEGSKMFPSGSITIDMFGQAYWQPKEFVAVSHARVTMLLPKLDILKDKYVGMFIASCLTKHFESLSAYESMCCIKVIVKEHLTLPVTTDGTPDWSYMAEYMQRLEVISKKNLAFYLNPTEHNNIDLAQWKNFCISDLFILSRGKSKKSGKKKGDTPYVSASKENNGVSDSFSCDSEVINGNKITISSNGSVGETFWQKDDFLACQDVIVAEPNTQKYPDFKLNKNIALFFNAILRRKGRLYSWDDKWCMGKVEVDSIPLPVTTNGTPDWNYMESYISKLENVVAYNSVLK